LALVIAVVPTFGPDHAVVARLERLRTLVDGLIVVDDGSPDSAAPVLERIEALDARLIRSPRNLGIAHALNRGIEAALADGADYVLTVDQDTDLPPEYVQRCLDTFAAANAVTRLGIVCVDAVNGRPSLPTWYSPEGLGLVPEAIQTGFLISRECLQETGLLDERLFIDCVDTEYCLRARDRGFRIAVASGTDVRHALGRRAPMRPFGIPLRRAGRTASYQYHPPLRRYYITRNNIDLLLRYARARPRWVLGVIRREYPPAVTTLVCGPQRLRQGLAFAAGLVHGLRRRRGPVPRALGLLLRG